MLMIFVIEHDNNDNGDQNVFQSLILVLISQIGFMLGYYMCQLCLL